MSHLLHGRLHLIGNGSELMYVADRRACTGSVSFFIWDPLAIFKELRTELSCPCCHAKGVVSTDGWASAPRRIADLRGLVLMLARRYKHEACPENGGELSVTSLHTAAISGLR